MLTNYLTYLKLKARVSISDWKVKILGGASLFFLEILLNLVTFDYAVYLFYLRQLNSLVKYEK